MATRAGLCAAKCGCGCEGEDEHKTVHFELLQKIVTGIESAQMQIPNDHETSRLTILPIKTAII